ncbi:MAG: PAS domain-containing protein [Legionellales bacterium]
MPLSSKQLAYIADYMPQIVWITNEIGELTYCNQRWVEFTGLSLEATLQGEWDKVVHPDDILIAMEAWAQAIQNPKLYEAETRLKRASDNTYRCHLVRGYPVRNALNQVEGWVGTSTDIHDYKNLQNHLEEISGHLTLALESAQIGTWSRNLKDNKLYWDDNTYKILGLKDHKLPITYEEYKNNIIHPLDREKSMDSVKTAMENQQGFDCEYRIIWPDGSIRTIISKGRYHKDQSGKNIKLIGVCFDVTDRKQTQTLIHQNQLDFAQQSKQSSISEIASSLAHELTQPIAAISMFTQECINQLENQKYNFDNFLFALKESAIQTHRAGEIIHRIKNSVQKRLLVLKPADFNEIIYESIKFINYEKNDHCIEIKIQTSPELPLINMDRIQIQQVLINLLRNALEALQEHRAINPHIEVICKINDNMLTTEIVDNGPGFPPEIEYQIDNIMSTKTSGMGIGLFICRSIIEAHGGKLTLGPSNEGGAQVQFKIPVYKENA